MAEIPGAPPQPWIVRNPTIPHGKVDNHKIAQILDGRGCLRDRARGNWYDALVEPIKRQESLA